MRRKVHVEIDFAGAKALHRGRHVVDRIVVDGIELDLRRIDEARVLDQLHMIVRPPLGKRVRPVRNQNAGLRPIVRMLLDHMLRHRPKCRLRQQPDQDRRRLAEFDHEGARIGRADAQGRRRRLTCGNGGAVLDLRAEFGKRARGLRIHRAAERVDEIRRRHLDAVRPGEPLAQLERGRLSVGADRPALCRARHRHTVGAVLHEPHEQIAHDLVLADQRLLRRIQRPRLGQIAAVKNALRPRGRQPRKRDESRDRKAHPLTASPAAAHLCR